MDNSDLIVRQFAAISRGVRLRPSAFTTVPRFDFAQQIRKQWCDDAGVAPRPY